MRFEITGVLDTIEQHLTTDVVLAQAVVDLGEVAYFIDLDRGRPVNLLRIGLVVDALARHLAQSAAMIYPVVGRGLMTDADLTSKERMVLGRWAGDGLIEVLPTVADRAVEVADLTGLPLITRGGHHQFTDRYEWLVRCPERVLHLVPGSGGASLIGPAPVTVTPDGAGANLLAQQWRCPQADCPSFGARRAADQGVPRTRAGVPCCPRHDEPLRHMGTRAPGVALAVVIDGVVRDRFVVRSGSSTVVGRRPDDDGSVALGPWLAEDAARWVSRRHLQLDLNDGALMVTDSSTNGTIVKTRPAQFGPVDEVRLGSGQSRPLGRWDTLQLHQGVELGRVAAFAAPALAELGSVMADAPTIALRPPALG